MACSSKIQKAHIGTKYPVNQSFLLPRCYSYHLLLEFHSPPHILPWILVRQFSHPLMARIRTVLYGYLPCLILLCACRMVLLWYSSLLFHPSEWLFSRAVSLGEQIPSSLPEPSSCAFLASSMYFFLLASGAITGFQNHVLPSGCLGPLWCILWLQVASAITCLVLLTLSVFFLRACCCNFVYFVIHPSSLLLGNCFVQIYMNGTACTKLHKIPVHPMWANTAIRMGVHLRVPMCRLPFLFSSDTQWNVPHCCFLSVHIYG